MYLLIPVVRFFVHFELSMSNYYHHCLPHYIVLLFCSIEFRCPPDVFVSLCLTTHVCFFFSFSLSHVLNLFIFTPSVIVTAYISMLSLQKSDNFIV